MGYSTDYTGQVRVDPPLNKTEITYLLKFAETRRMHRSSGPYFVDGGGDFGQAREADVIDYNEPPSGQPGLWCQWVPTDDGASIEWDGGEKFREGALWMKYLIEHFLMEGGCAQLAGSDYFNDFTFDHVVNGVIEAQGEKADDHWDLVVENNIVTCRDYEEAEEI